MSSAAEQGIVYDESTTTLTVVNPLLTVMRVASDQPFGFRELPKRFRLRRNQTYQLVYGLSKPIAKFKLSKQRQLRYKLISVYDD